MNHLITGLHHVTAVSGEAQGNIDFYTRILGLRLVKKTVNFDNPEVYHFYFGDQGGAPGTLMTTFPYGGGLPKGRHGKGMVVTTAFSLSVESIDYWLSRLDHFEVPYKHPQQRFGGEVFIYLEDNDGLGLELVFSDKDTRKGFDNGEIPLLFSIRGIHHVEMWLDSIERTAALLIQEMNHQVIHDGGYLMRLGVKDLPGHYVDLAVMPGVMKGLGGRGLFIMWPSQRPTVKASSKCKADSGITGSRQQRLKTGIISLPSILESPGGGFLKSLLPALDSHQTSHWSTWEPALCFRPGLRRTGIVWKHYYPLFNIRVKHESFLKSEACRGAFNFCRKSSYYAAWSWGKCRRYSHP